MERKKKETERQRQTEKQRDILRENRTKKERERERDVPRENRKEREKEGGDRERRCTARATTKSSYRYRDLPYC